MEGRRLGAGRSTSEGGGVRSPVTCPVQALGWGVCKPCWREGSGFSHSVFLESRDMLEVREETEGSELGGGRAGDSNKLCQFRNQKRI